MGFSQEEAPRATTTCRCPQCRSILETHVGINRINDVPQATPARKKYADDEDEESGSLLRRSSSTKRSAPGAARSDERSKEAQKNIFHIVKRLLSYAAADRQLISLGVAFVVLSSAFDAAIPNYTGRALAAIVDSVVNKVRRLERSPAGGGQALFPALVAPFHGSC